MEDEDEGVLIDRAICAEIKTITWLCFLRVAGRHKDLFIWWWDNFVRKGVLTRRKIISRLCEMERFQRQIPVATPAVVKEIHDSVTSYENNLGQRVRIFRDTIEEYTLRGMPKRFKDVWEWRNVFYSIDMELVYRRNN